MGGRYIARLMYQQMNEKHFLVHRIFDASLISVIKATQMVGTWCGWKDIYQTFYKTIRRNFWYESWTFLVELLRIFSTVETMVASVWCASDRWNTTEQKGNPRKMLHDNHSFSHVAVLGSVTFDAFMWTQFFIAKKRVWNFCCASVATK